MCLFFDPYASDDQGRYAPRRTYISVQKYKWAHFSGQKSLSFFLRAPYILRTTDFFGDNGGQRRQGLKPYLSEKAKMACRSIIHGARGLAVGVLTPYTLTAKLGSARISGSGPPKDDAWPGQPVRSPAQGVKTDLAIKQDLGRLE